MDTAASEKHGRSATGPPCSACSEPRRNVGINSNSDNRIHRTTSSGGFRLPWRLGNPSSSTPEFPGYVGTALIGDESLEFVRDPVAYVQGKSKQFGPVFKTRIMNKATIFVASSDAVKEMLEDKFECYRIGFLDHMKDMFGDNILFADGDELARLRSVIAPFFSRDSVEQCMPRMKKIIENCIPHIVPGEPVVLYELFKHLATELSLALFLGMSLDEIQEMVDYVVELGKTHWHGFISIPIKFMPSFLGSGFLQSMEAKAGLLKIIHDRIEAGKLSIAGSDDLSGFADVDEAARHVLVFISALIPKAFASLLTSFCLETAARGDVIEKCLEDDSFFDDTLLEVTRLWPPFLGSRRIAKTTHTLQGFTVTEGTPVLYMTHAANHDASIFPSPSKFMPERWAGDNSPQRDRVLTLGSGGRECIGKVLVRLLFKECARSVLENWRWEIPAGQDLAYKWLPVSRPSRPVAAVFSRVCACGTECPGPRADGEGCGCSRRRRQL